MNYRRELDGLRAIAVVSVVGFHAGLPHFSGGFIGVDIFFVLSGYLISSLLMEEMGNGRFSFARFYERRARRILPALIFVVLCCWPFAWSWMTPAELQRFCASVIATVFSYANHYFLSHHAYFSPATDEMPLLHTWSLSVEEQFYFLFPLILAFLWRWGRLALVCGVMLLALASFALAIWLNRDNSVLAFYLSVTRAWQLTAGVACALFVSVSGKPAPNTLLTLLGLAAVLVPVTYYDVSVAGPGLYAALPVLGTCIIILYADEAELGGRLLSTPPMVGLGLISYSAYLWHQPLLAFARLHAIDQPPLSTRGLLSIASFAAAALTWKFIEQPFRIRGPSAPFPTRNFLTATVAVIALLAGTSAYAHLAGGLPWRSAPNGQTFAELRLDERIEANMGMHDVCEDVFTLSDLCRTAENPELAVWGDSYAMHLVDGFISSTARPAVIQFTKSRCAPVAGLSLLDAEATVSWAEGCIRFSEQVMNWLVSSESLKVVVLASPFWGQLQSNLVVEGKGVATANQRAILREHLVETVKRLRSAGKRVVIVSPPPTAGINIGRCLAKSTLFALSLERCSFTTLEFASYYAASASFLQDMERAGLPVVWLGNAICENDSCQGIRDGVFVYRDAGHLSHEGSRLIGEKIGIYDVAMKIAR